MTSTTDAALDAQLKTVLDRESATHFRHDARVEALEIERDAAYARGVHDAAAIADPPLAHRKGNVGLWRKRRAEIAAAIRALTDAPPVPVVRVKPLVWEIVPTGYGPETYQAYAAIGFYQVFTDEDSSCGAVFAEFATNESQFGTVHARSVARVGGFIEAKVAAQADYEARILAALQPRTKGGDA